MLVPCIRDVRRYHHIPDEGNAGPPPYWSLVRRTFQVLGIGTEMPNVSNEACKCSTFIFAGVGSTANLVLLGVTCTLVVLQAYCEP